MKQCFGYVRVSTVKQGDGVSLEAQRDAIEHFAARNRIVITKWFAETVTAAKSGRPKFNRMVYELKRRRAAGVVFHKIDRSARNFRDWARIGDLQDAGIDIHFATESLDFNSRGGRLTADIQAVIAADYIRNLREECIKGIEGRLKQGLYPFKAPLGYLDNGGGKPKTIDPVRGPLIRTMFELYATGEYSHRSLVGEMEKRGLRSHKGHPVSQTIIETTLLNPFYAGLIKVKTTGKLYQGIHEPLISMGLFDAVHGVRTGRGHKVTTRHRYLYRGLLTCGLCGLALIAERQKGHVYYRCHTPHCDTKTIREESIDDALADLYTNYELTDDGVKRARARMLSWLESSSHSLFARQAPLELVKLSERLSRLMDKFIDDQIDQETFNTKKAEILSEQARWNERLEGRAALNKNREQLEKFLELAKSLYSSHVMGDYAEKRELIKFATSNRTVCGKDLELEPSIRLSIFEKLANSIECPLSKGDSRTLQALFDLGEGEFQSSHFSQGNCQ